jgi:hypothetical protein
MPFSGDGATGAPGTEWSKRYAKEPLHGAAAGMAPTGWSAVRGVGSVYLPGKKVGTSGGACLPTLECFIITCDGPAAVATGGGAPFQWSILLGETTDDVAGIGTVPEISASCSSQIRSPKILSKSSDSGWSHAPRPLHSYYRLPRFVVLRTIDGDVEPEPIAYASAKVVWASRPGLRAHHEAW